MKKAFLVFLALIMIGSVAVAEDGGEDSKAYISIGDYNEAVVDLHRKLSDLGYYGLRPESPWGPASENAVKILQENLDLPITGIVESKDQLDQLMNADHVIGKNLAIGTSSEWSEWFTPEFNIEASCFTVGTVNLTDKKIGDYYTCQVEVEYKGVTASEGQKFWFRSQGTADGLWGMNNNPWNNYVSLRESPSDGIYKYSIAQRITEENVDYTKFELGFRCDYWASGSFRVRNVKVVKGYMPAE